MATQLDFFQLASGEKLSRWDASDRRRMSPRHGAMPLLEMPRFAEALSSLAHARIGRMISPWTLVSLRWIPL